MNYDLKKLVEWTRRAAGDRVRSVREVQVGIGIPTLTLANEGFITLRTLLVDRAVVKLTDVEVDGNTLTFQDDLAEGAEVIVTYGQARYNNTEILEFLGDGAMAVSGDLRIGWTVSKSSGMISNIPDKLITGTPATGIDLDARVQKLLAYRASLDIYTDKANLAADRAISVRDGDTSIDTSKTSGSSEKAVERLTERYQEALQVANSELFRGAANIEPPACNVLGWRPVWNARNMGF